MIYTVTMNPSLDLSVFTEDFQRGKLNRASSQEIFAGGKGINVSYVLHALGNETCALGYAAGYTGDMLEKMLENSGVKTDFIRLEEGFTRINVKLHDADETEINGAGPVLSADHITALKEKLKRLKSGDVLVLSGNVPAGAGSDIYRKLIRCVQSEDVPVTVDAEKELLRCTLDLHPFLIKPNIHELEDLFNSVIKEEDLPVYCRKLQEAGAGNILVSMGGDGAFMMDENGCTYRMAAPEGQMVNPIGAGDSAVAGFIDSWLREHDFKKAFEAAVITGSATAFSHGLADREAIRRVKESMR